MRATFNGCPYFLSAKTMEDKKLKKKFLVLLVVMVAITCSAIALLALVGCNDEKTVDGVVLKNQGDGYTVSGLPDPNVTELVIPSEYDGKPITAIANYAFMDCKNLTSVVIPDGVTSIGRSAFEGCTNLTSIIIPDSITEIGDYAFYGCYNIETATAPVSALKFDKHNLKTVIITSGETIGGGTVNDISFSGCRRLVNVSLPDTLTSIGGFSGCTSLTSLTIPKSMTTIDKYAYTGCTSLTSLTIPDSVTSIGENAFNGCTSLTNITIPDGVTSIGNYAFGGCTSLANIAIPDSVTSIGN